MAKTLASTPVAGADRTTRRPDRPRRSLAIRSAAAARAMAAMSTSLSLTPNSRSAARTVSTSCCVGVAIAGCGTAPTCQLLFQAATASHGHVMGVQDASTMALGKLRD